MSFVLAFPVILQTLNGPHPFQGLHGTPALPQPVSLGVVFLLVTGVMAGLGQGTARLFVRFRPLRAYRLDILGSLAGIAAFTGLSFLDQPPGTWGVIACAGLLVLLAPKIRWWQILAVASVATMLLLESFAPAQEWSPYNKLVYNQVHGATGALYVSANNIPYQAARSLALMHKQKAFYFYPYRHVAKGSLGNVLIIGSGTGNDAAVALSEGARHVDTVEIDPLLVRLGNMHPNHPYSSPRLTAHIDDGRAYLADTTKHYNLILFALPDSLTALAGQSGIRLESYLLTLQSLQAVRAHLAPGGTFAMYNYYAPFLESRYASTIQDAFGRTPCTEVGPPLGGRRLAVLTVHPGGPVPNCASYYHGSRIAPATDDHPFPYLPGNDIPKQYLWMIAAIFAASLLLVRVGGGSFSRMRNYVDLAFMGAAFLLLETKNIVQFALLFGTTWLVNSLVFAGVLLAVYLAVETASHLRLPRPAVLYAALIAALVVDLGGAAGVAGGPAHRGSLLRGQRAGLRPDLPGQPHLRPAVLRRGDLRGCVRGQPARGHGRRGPGVHRLDHRVPVPADRHRRALRLGVRDQQVPDQAAIGRRGQGRGAGARGRALGCTRALAVRVLVWLPARFPDGRPPDTALTRNDLMTSPGPGRPGACLFVTVRPEQPQRRVPDGRGDGPGGHAGGRGRNRRSWCGRRR